MGRLLIGEISPITTLIRIVESYWWIYSVGKRGFDTEEVAGSAASFVPAGYAEDCPNA